MPISRRPVRRAACRPVTAIVGAALLMATTAAVLAVGTPASAASAISRPSPAATTPAAPPTRPAAITPAAPATSSASAMPAVTVICNKYCDGRDPALSPGDRQPVTATIFGRTITMHYDDADAMGWAAITNGSPTDEVWIDRSFDGGRTWTTKLGDTTIPTGNTGWRTLMYNVDDWNNLGVGVLRACGKAGNRPDTVCTPWSRTTWNAGNRQTAAATALMEFYDLGTGLFDTTGWWNSANALTAIIDNARVTGMGSYEYAISRTYNDQINAMSGSFRDAYLDDTGWWGLAWIDAYDLTGDGRYLTTARADADYMAQYWDGTCGGGIWWSTAKTAKNAIANSLYLDINASLHNRIPGDTTYLGRANQEWTWFQNSGMINSSHLINDGLNLSTCKNNGQPVWSYNQGVPLAGLVAALQGDRQSGAADQRAAARERIHDELDAEPERHPCGTRASPVAAAATGRRSRVLTYVGSVRSTPRCPSRPYNAYLGRQATSAYNGDRNPQDAYGLHWAGPLDSTDAARQQSALDLMNVAS